MHAYAARRVVRDILENQEHIFLTDSISSSMTASEPVATF